MTATGIPSEQKSMVVDASLQVLLAIAVVPGGVAL
jgi:hypothetical protein